MKTGLPMLACTLPLLLFSIPAAAQSLPAISAGARLAANCAACHGTNGITDGVALPSLAGQGKGALLVALKAFKAGARQGTIMPQIAKGYTDEQLAQLAEYFAAQPAVPTAVLPDRAAAESRVAVTGWPQERGSLAGSGDARAVLRIAGAAAVPGTAGTSAGSRP